MISTIIFDVGEVLLTGLKGVEHRLSPLVGIPASQIFAEPTSQWDLVKELFNGEITEDQFVDRVLQTSKWRLSPLILKKIIRENFAEIEGTRNIVESLHKKGFKLGLLSDHAREWVDHCNEKFNHHAHFHAKVYSFDVGATKPHKKGYLALLEKLDSKPYESIFIDDNPRNLAAAKEIGIKIIQFKDAGQLRKDLALFGVHV